MKEVMIEADTFDNIAWPSICACCGGNNIRPRNYEIIYIPMEYSLLGHFSRRPDRYPLNICNECTGVRARKRILWLRVSLITSVLFILCILWAGIAESIRATHYNNMLSVALPTAILFFSISIFSWLKFAGYHASDYWKRCACKCIRISKDVLLLQFANDLFANQFRESNICLQTQEQRHTEEYKRQQEEAEYEKEQQRAEEKNEPRFEQAEQESDAYNAQQTVKDEREQEAAQRERPAQEPQIGTKKGLAIASLVCAFLSFASMGLFGIPAIILGHIAMNKINDSPTKYGGKDLAKAGLIVGYIGLVVMVAVILLAISD